MSLANEVKKKAGQSALRSDCMSQHAACWDWKILLVQICMWKKNMELSTLFMAATRPLWPERECYSITNCVGFIHRSTLFPTDLFPLQAEVWCCLLGYQASWRFSIVSYGIVWLLVSWVPNLHLPGLAADRSCLWGDFSNLRMASAEDLGGQPPLKCATELHARNWFRCCVSDFGTSKPLKLGPVLPKHDLANFQIQVDGPAHHFSKRQALWFLPKSERERERNKKKLLSASVKP